MTTYRTQPSVALIRSWPAKTRLLNYFFAVRRVSVRGRLLSFLMLFGILFGAVLLPATAHAQGSDFAHAGEVLDIHESAPTAAHNPAEQAPDVPGQAASHHHCTIALEVIAPAIFAAPEIRDRLLRPAISRTLVSHAEAPPTEPPAA